VKYGRHKEEAGEEASQPKNFACLGVTVFLFSEYAY